MSAAEREAERRFPLWLPTGDYEIDREDYSELDAKWQNEDTERDRAHFVQGAEWQAERDAGRIAELEAEVEHLRAQVPPCDGGCSYGDGPQEDCSAHGRRPTDLWSLLHEEHEMGRAAHERAEAAEAKLAAVRADRDATREVPARTHQTREAGVTDEMVEAGARGLTRHYFAEEGIYNPCEAKVTEHTVEPIRDIARAVLEAVYGKQGSGR